MSAVTNSSLAARFGSLAAWLHTWESASVMLFWLGLALLFSLPVAVTALLGGLYLYLCRQYLDLLVRLIQVKPLFIIPRGQFDPDAEEVSLRTEDGLTLRGCYFRGTGPRRGVILFGLEYGSNRWACVPYCDFLLAHGFDVFTLEPRSQGDSDRQPGYEPLQWVTEYEVRDMETALAYLKDRPDADPRGIGLFGISKGAAAGLLAAARDPYVRCAVTDGVFATYTTVVPYMRQWFRIYNSHYALHGLIPMWYYGRVALASLRRAGQQRSCRFVHLESALSRLAPRPLLMIHGEADTYIKPEMARSLFERARAPKEFWLVEGAKHNQSLHTAGDAYRRRVLEFFLQHLEESARDEGRKGRSEDSRTGCPVSSLVPPLRPSSNIPSR